MDLSKIVKDRKLILDRLPLLESGGQYAAQWHIGLKQELYNKEAEGIAALQISALKDDEAEGRPKTFAEMKALREEGKFEEVKIGDEFGESWDCWWFYVQFEVKQSWIDAQHEIHFFWDSDSEALLYTEEGKVMQGFLGEDAELSERRRAYYILKREGFKDDLVLGKVNYYIQMSCMRFKGCWNDDRTNFHSGVNMHLTFKLKQCELKAFNREVWDMLWDYYIVKECASELETSQSSRAYDAMYTGEIISDKCKPNDSSTFPECRTLAKNFMDVENSASQHQIYAMGHCHIDLGWLWPFKETPKKIGRSWSIQRELMNFYPSHRFCSSSSKIFEIVKEQYNELYVDMKAKALAEEPTFFPVGGSYIEFDCNLPNGESMCRQFLLGQRFFAQEFGTRRELFFMPDTFGYTGALPQIMALSGIKYFVTTKLGWSIFNEFPHNTFYWKGIDGSTILAHYPPAHYSSTRGYVKEVLLSQTQFKDKGRSNSSMMFFGFGGNLFIN
jgi:alpha-mannosidase